MVLFPAPAGPSIAITTRRRSLLISRHLDHFQSLEGRLHDQVQRTQQTRVFNVMRIPPEKITGRKWGNSSMSIGTLFASLGLLTASALLAQGPLYDKVEVTLPYPVMVNNTTLQPGDYVIRPHDNADRSGPRL